MERSAATATPRRLTDRRALVTGATSGIGRAIAERLAAEGATVVVSGRSEAEGRATVASITAAGGRAAFVTADLSAGAAVIEELARAAAEVAGGAVDILVNNAARLIAAQSLLDVDEDLADQALAVNIKAPMLLTKALVPGMLEAGGAIVNIGSINGEVGMGVAALYGSTKAAIHSLTTSWAGELASRGVRVNAVAPGPTMTPENSGIHDLLHELTQNVPDRRPGTAAEVAATVAFLVSDDASHVHGAILPVDGGYLAAR